jgi:signal transduction histidine kinase
MPGDDTEAGGAALTASGEHEARLENALSRLQQGVVVVDRELTVDYVNPAAARLLAPLDPPLQGEPLPADSAEVPLRAFARRLFHEGAARSNLLAVVGERAVSVHGVPPDGSETVVLVLEDVTERERLRIAEHEFVENAAHELRTPLAAIVSVVDVLDSGAKDDPDTRDRFLAHLRAHSERVARLSTSLLALARVHTGQQEPRFELVPVTPMLEQIVHDLRPRPGVDIVVRASDKIAALTDPELLHHALYNVAANAVKNTPSGEIALEARVAGQEIELEIRDSGRGMSREDLERAFDRFHRARDSAGNGFGLGLSIAKDAIEAVGGTIALESEPGEGVRASITLPGARILS